MASVPAVNCWAIIGRPLPRTDSIYSRDVAFCTEACVTSHDYDRQAFPHRIFIRWRVAKAVGYAEGVALISGNLAALALDRKDWSAAATLAREALPLSEKVGRQEIIACDCLRLAQALARQDKKAEARHYAQRAVDIFTRLGSPHTEEARKRPFWSAKLNL